MVAVTFSISEDLQVFIEDQTVKNGFHSTDDYLRNLLDRERERERLEGMLIEGLEIGKPIEVNDDWWEQKRSSLLKP